MRFGSVQFGFGFPFAALVSLTLQSGYAVAATFPVTLTTDPLPCGTTVGTLRHAILQANAAPGTDLVRVDVGGTLTLNAACGGLVILDQVSIKSRTTFSIRPPGPNFGDLLHIVMLNDLHAAGISYLVLDGRGVGFEGNRAVRLERGHLSLNTTYIRGFFSPTTNNGDGAAILVRTANFDASNLTLTKVLIQSNRAAAFPTSSGAGLFFDGFGVMTIAESLFESNYAEGFGGAIAFSPNNLSGTSTLRHSTLRNNEARLEGGGIRGVSSGMALSVQNTTIHGNRASGPAAMGGGISVGTGALVLSFVTLTDNTASSATQIFREGGSTDINGTAISGAAPVCVGTINGSPNTISSDNSCAPIPDTVAAVDLGPLLNNGGTCGSSFHDCLTRAPNAGSPLIGGSASCPASGDDQRHVPRGLAPCWIGAFED